MAAPNLLSLTTATGKTIGVALTTSLDADLLTNTAASGKVLKINSMYVANIDGTNSVNIDVGFNDASAATAYKIANTIALAADTTQVIVNKNAPIYLEEGDILEGGASANSDAVAVISYEELS